MHTINKYDDGDDNDDNDRTGGPYVTNLDSLNLGILVEWGRAIVRGIFSKLLRDYEYYFSDILQNYGPCSAERFSYQEMFHN